VGGVVQRHRAVAFGAGLYRMVGLQFAAAFTLAITVGQVLAYSRGMRPGLDYAAARRARLTRRQLWGAIIRTGGYIALALICSAWVRHVDHAWSFAIRVGLVTGLVTVLGTLVNPYIEY
jgi:CDP-diglyceride synthetase